MADEALARATQATAIALEKLRKERTPKFDQLEWARRTIDRIGWDNVIFADQSFWLWNGIGAWAECDDKAIKQHVQRTLEGSGITVNSSTVNGVTDVLRNELFRADHRFNTGPSDVVNCLNCELELSPDGWRWQHHRREHYRTTQIPVHYDPAAQAPQFWRFLYDVFRDDHDRDYKVQATLELIGYSLMSHAKYERFVMLIGSGGNGKSVLLRIIEALVGPRNVAGVQPAEFKSKWQRAHLHMKLANIVTELKHGEVIADAELKAITSGELTTVERKNKNPFEMRAYATCWFGTNHMPHTRDFSDALFRRAIILTFNRSFAEHEQDRDLKDKLATELPGILNFSLTAYARATVHGFTAPQSSVEAKRKWRLEADQVAQFVEQECATDPLNMVAVDELYRRFRNWALDGGIRQIVGKQAMGDRMEALGYNRKRSNGSWITGLAMRRL